jgi:hypothetical protein
VRSRKPWFRSSRNAWYVEKDGRQHFLGSHPEDTSPPMKVKGEWKPPPGILDAFYKLMAGTSEIPPAKMLSVASVCDLFLLHSQQHNTPQTFEWYEYFLQSFCDLHRTLPAIEVKPFHVTQWLDGKPTWTASRRNALNVEDSATHGLAFLNRTFEGPAHCIAPYLATGPDRPRPAVQFQLTGADI